MNLATVHVLLEVQQIIAKGVPVLFFVVTLIKKRDGRMYLCVFKQLSFSV